METIKDRLAQMSDDWTATTPHTPEVGPRIPAGEHTVTLTKSEVFVTSAGKLVWLLSFQDEHGREIDKWNELERKQSVEYIKADAILFGHRGEIVDLDEWAPSVVGSVCRIRVKHVPSDQGGDPFVRVYLNEVTDLASNEPATAPSTQGPTGEQYADADDITF